MSTMWCAKCKKIQDYDVCDVCGSQTEPFVPTEIYWCDFCNSPIIQEFSEEQNIFCPECGYEITKIAKDMRPVFPEERLLLEIISGEPFAYMETSVWANNNRYYVDGRASGLSLDKLKKLDISDVVAKLNEYKEQNTYRYFDEHIERFVKCNRDRLSFIKEEASNFVRKQVDAHKDQRIVVSFSGGKDSTAVSDIVLRELEDPSVIQIFGDTTLEFPMTYDYVKRYRKANPKVVLKTTKNREQNFYDVCNEIGPPARMMRWCCTMFKTGPITRTFNALFRDSKILTFYGIRKSESINRSKYDRVANGANVKIQKQTVASPIFYWMDIDVWLYLLAEQVDFNDAYRLGYDRVGCWCCPNNNARSQLLSKIYMPEQSEKWRNYLIGFAKRIGKEDPEVYVDEGKWKARQGGNGLAAAEDVKIKYTNCTAEDNAKIYRLNKPIQDEFYDLFIPFGKVSHELGRKLLHEVLVLDLATNVPILSIQPFDKSEYDYAVKIRTMNVADHKSLQRMAAYQVRKYNACRKCLKCESVCPHGAISVSSVHYKIDDEKCKRCKRCVTAKYLDGGCLMERFLKSKVEEI